MAISNNKNNICPASSIQQQFWLVNQLHPDNSAHNIQSVFRIKGALNLSALEKSLKEIICRHEIFRTTFFSIKGELIQVISPEISFAVPVINVSDSTQKESDEYLYELIIPEITQPFVLSRGPLIRCKLFKLASDQYILTIVMHHIITDLRTKDLFSDELSALYNAFDENRASPLDEQNLQYSDYVLWHKNFQKDETHDKMLFFWKKLVGNTNDFLNLPVDKKRPPVQSLQGAAYPFHLSKLFTDELKQFSKQNKTDIFLTLFTAYIVLLGRYSNQADFIVGIPFENRRKEEHKKIMGCFVNILPVPADLSGNPDFKEVMSRVRKAMLVAHRNQEATFESIVNEVQPIRNVSYNPLFQAGFTFEHPMNISFNNTEISPLSTHYRGSQLDIFAIFRESENGIKGYFEYCTSLFTSLSIERFAESYRFFLYSLLKNPERPVAQQPILNENEKNKILFKWNDTKKKYQKTHILHRIFEKQVAKTPDLTALQFNEQQLTYSDLNKQANKLAHFILKFGVKAGTYIGIFMDRSVEMVIAIYGIIKAGCAYVPFDPEYPVERIKFMIKDTLVPVMLTQKHLSGQLPDSESSIVCLDSEWESIEKYPDTNPDISITPDDPAYVIFTSGSTGLPKGVINSHRGICNRLLWMQDEYKLTESDSVLQKTPFSFDVSVWEFFWPLLTGAKLVIAPPESHKDPLELIFLIIENNITTIHFVPSMLHVFIENQNAGKCSCLKRVICSGEALQYDDQEKFFSCLDAKLYNLYGPTEAAVDVTCWKCINKSENKTVPIGRPVANTQIYILDSFLNPVPVGVQGELHIGGVQVASGYLNRPALTNEKFIHDPFVKQSDARLYKTGDLARFLSDGNIEYLGRIDRQVKIRGLRIELGEIESVLCDHPGVGNAAVVVKEYGANDQRLVGYIVPDSNNAFTVRAILELEKQSAFSWKLHELPNGMIICCRNENEVDFMYREIFEKCQYTTNGIVLKQGACIFDAGANIGLFSLFLANTVKDAQIYSFEPIPPIYEILQANASFYNANIKTFPVGLSCSSGHEVFKYYPDVSIISGRYAYVKEEKKVVRAHIFEDLKNSTRDSLLSEEVLDELLEEKLKNEDIVCELVTISEIIENNNIKKIDLLKIDVEKSEQEVLFGIDDHDWEKIMQIVIEVHDRSGQLVSITELLESKDYNITVKKNFALEGADLYLLYAVRPEYTAQNSEHLSIKKTDEIFKWIKPSHLASDIKQYLQKKIPGYMIPSLFVMLDEMPLTVNGKINRRILPDPETKRSDFSKEYVAPQTDLEKMIKSIWSKILKIDQIGIHDNFFDIGGDSLLSVYVISLLQIKLKKEISIIKMFQYPTIYSFANFLSGEKIEQPLFEKMKNRADLRKKALYDKRKKR